ncbi:MAG: OmpA family protein [Rudaea sp.]
MRMSIRFYGLGLLLCLSAPLLADSNDGKDCEGCSDGGVSARYPGAVLFGADQKAFEESIFATGPVGKNDAGDKVAPKTITLTGKRTRAFYVGPAQRSGLEIFANYRAALEKSGMSIVWTCSNDEQCGPEFLSEATRVMHLSLTGTAEADEGFQLAEAPRYLLASQNRPQGSLHVMVFVADIPHTQRAGVYIVQLEDKPMDKGMAATHEGVGDSAPVEIAIPAAAQSAAVATQAKPAMVETKTVDSATLNSNLANSGQVNVYGIHFDFDKADVTPESKPQLDEIAKLLSANPALKLRVTGHTDSVGSAAHNLELSARRADAIVSVLETNYAISASRLSAAGVGASVPVASNDTDLGRALNRRVELIKQ